MGALQKQMQFSLNESRTQNRNINNESNADFVIQLTTACDFIKEKRNNCAMNVHCLVEVVICIQTIN